MMKFGNVTKRLLFFVFIRFYFFFPSGLFVKALVHLIVSHIGAFHSSLQLLLDHPRITAMASQ